MTLLVTVFAAVIATVLWYKDQPENNMRLGLLSLTYWGASLMWLIDAIFEYSESGAEYFTPAASDMLNDLYLGLSAAALGAVIWLVALLIRDPKGRVKAALSKKK